MISLPALDAAQEHMWTTLFGLAERRADWTLVGGQMVFLHAHEHGRVPQRISTDADVIVDVRVRPAALPRFVSTLSELGFEASLSGNFELAYRFVRGDVQIDVLAPDGLGERADIRTIGNAQTLQAVGGSFALSRSELVDIEAAGMVGVVPRPDLVGAIVIKARAASADRRPERHLSDLALLCALVEDPITLRDTLSLRQRGYLRALLPLDDPAHEAWLGLGADATRARDAFALIRSA